MFEYRKYNLIHFLHTKSFGGETCDGIYSKNIS
jgi:hypothetical protein